MSLNNKTSIIINESWFILVDIINIICNIFAMVLDKTCRTIPMILAANSCLAELTYTSDLFAMDLFALQYDLKQIEFQDSVCIFLRYSSYMMIGIQDYSYLSISRYFLSNSFVLSFYL